MAESAIATFTVEIAPADKNVQGHVSVELATNWNYGRTQFNPGDSIYYRVYTSNNATVLDPVLSAGTMRRVDSDQVTRLEQLQFNYPKEFSKTLPKPANSISNIKWFGEDFGTPSLQPDGLTINIPRPAGLPIIDDVFTSKIGILVMNTITTVQIYQLEVPTQVAGSNQFTIAGIIPARIS